jgi:N-methylhydantoinase A
MTQTAITRLATDIGGTFTDIVLEHGDERFTTKVLTTPHAPEEAVVEGTRLVLNQAGHRAWAPSTCLVHGTTLATNAVIERKGAKHRAGRHRRLPRRARDRRTRAATTSTTSSSTSRRQSGAPRTAASPCPSASTSPARCWLDLDEAAVRAPLAAALKCRGRRQPSPSRLIHSYANAARAGAPHPRDPRPTRRPASPITLSSEVCPESARVRAHLHRRRQRLCPAADGRLSRPPGKARLAAAGYPQARSTS